MDAYLSSLFSFLNAHHIQYFLLTDFEGDLVSNDIDIYVYPGHKAAFEKALFQLGWYRRKEPAFHINHNFYYSPKSRLYLDVKYELSFAGGTHACYTYLSPAAPQPNSKDIYRPHGFDAVLLYAAHLAYRERGKLEEKHRQYLTLYLDIYRHEVDSANLQVLEQIRGWLQQDFPENVDTLQHILLPYFRLEKRRMTRSGGLKYGYGFNVLFLGTDGVGKTTLVEAVGKKLNLKNNRLYLGAGENSWSSHFMKNIYEYKFQAKPIDKVYSLVKTFAVLPLELSIRMAPVLRKSRYNVTLIDRFPGFVFLDKKPGRARLYKSILPTQDLVIFLHADPAELVRRKPNETSLERSQKDIDKFRKVADIISKGTYKSVDTSKLSIEEASDYIISEIYNHPRLQKRLFTTEPSI